MSNNNDKSLALALRASLILKPRCIDQRLAHTDVHYQRWMLSDLSSHLLYINLPSKRSLVYVVH